MTTLLDAPATTRKEKTMLKRKMAALADQETTTDLPAVEQESTSVVTDDTTLEQSTELVADASAEAATETTEPESVVEAVMEASASDADDEFPVAKPHTGGLPMVAFKPVRKDMSDDYEVPYTAPMSMSPFFADDEDESGIQDRSVFRKRLSDEELEALDAELDAKEAIAKPIRDAEEKARKEQAAKAEVKRLARIEKRGSRRMLGKIMLAGSALAFIYGIAVPYMPWM